MSKLARPNNGNVLSITKGLNQLTNGFKQRNVAVIRSEDLRRMRDVSHDQLELEKHERQQKERLGLRELSENRVKSWSNTIEGQRLKKLAARKIREEQDELDRQKIDIEEAKLQAKKRKDAIQDAKRLQYMQTDRVKGFHSALTLTEVLKERDAQVKMNLCKKERIKHKDDVFVRQRKQNFEDSIVEERVKANAKVKKALETAGFQKQQMEDRLLRAKEIKLEDVAEGRQIKEHWETYKQALQNIDKTKTQDKVELRDSYFREWDFKKERVKEEKVKEIEIENEIKKFVNAKRQMALMRKEKEDELFNAFQKHTKNICDQLSEDMKSRVDDEDDRIAKAVYEREMKRLKEEEEKAQAELESIKETNLQRLRMIKDHENERKENMLRDKAFLEQRMKNDMSFKQGVEKANLKKRNEAIAVQDFYNQQMASFSRKQKEERKKQLEFDAENMKALEKDEEMFQEYAGNVIEDAKRNERSLFPLLKAKNEGPGGGRGPKFLGNAGLRPSYIVQDATGVQLSHYRKDEKTQCKAYVSAWTTIQMT